MVLKCGYSIILVWSKYSGLNLVDKNKMDLCQMINYSIKRFNTRIMYLELYKIEYLPKKREIYLFKIIY